MLINLARATLDHAGWSEQLLTGRYTWDLGSGVRNVKAKEPTQVLKIQPHEEL